jgi:hypothetical protein
MSIKRLSSVLLALTIAVTPSRALAQGDTPPGRSGSITELLRYEPTGLSLMSPYARGKTSFTGCARTPPPGIA